jgi:hypothetical protein
LNEIGGWDAATIEAHARLLCFEAAEAHILGQVVAGC